MLLFKDFIVTVLFDTGAIHSFIYENIGKQLTDIHKAPFQLRIVSPMGKQEINVHYIVSDDLYIGKKKYPDQLILLDMKEYNTILGIN